MILDTDVLNSISMLRLRKTLNTALAPVKPRIEFRNWLKQELLENAEALHSTRRWPEWLERGSWLVRPGKRELIIGAAVGSAVSVAGLVALVIHIAASNKRTTSQAA
jgi:hypothetical protein